MSFYTIKRETGFSIIEIMVGLAVGLIAMLVILGLYAGFESQKRTTTSGSDAHTTGTLALYSMSRNVRQAGYGFADLNVLNCTVKAYNEQRTPSTFNFPAMAPVIINPVITDPTTGVTTPIPAGDTNTDIIQVTYGNSDGLVGGVEFTQQSGASANYKVTNRAGFTVGNLVLAAEPGQACTVAQITGLPDSGSCGSGGGTGQTDVIIHNNGNFQDPHQSCANVQSYWNKPGGLGVTYNTGKLFDLGALPTTIVYAVRNNKLTQCDFLTKDCTNAALVTNTTVWVPIADNIVGLQAQYGRDTIGAADQTVDLYDKTTPSAACGWARIPVVHIALLARSTNYEKAEVPQNTSNPRWLGGANGTFGMSHLPSDWKHYRYKVFETTIPLRNIIWMGVQSSC